MFKRAWLCSIETVLTLLKKKKTDLHRFGPWPIVYFSSKWSCACLSSWTHLVVFSCWHSPNTLASSLFLHLSFLPQTFTLSNPSSLLNTRTWLALILTGLSLNVVSFREVFLDLIVLVSHHLVPFYPKNLSNLVYSLHCWWSFSSSKMQISYK